MSPRKSDIPSFPRSGWRDTLLCNVPFLLLLAAMLPLGYFIEQSGWVEHYYARMITLIGFNVILAVSLQLINGFSGQFSLGHAGFMAVGAYLAAYPAITYADAYNNPTAVLLFFTVLAVVAGFALAVLFGVFTACRLSRRWHPSLPAVLMLLLIAWVLTDLAQASRYATPPTHLIWARGIALIVRANDAMLTHGLPTAARISAALPVALRQPLCMVILLFGAGCCAAATGLIVGLPALRLRGDYLAIATLGMGEIIRIIIINTPALGGALALTSIPHGADFAWIYGMVIVTVVVIWRVAYSASGRAIMAVREDEIAAAAVGVNNTVRKVTAFAIGAFFAGVAGALFSLGQGSITPNLFSMGRSIEIVVMVTLGGLGSISGAILAAVVLTLLPEMLRFVEDYRMIIYSLTLVIMMLVRPQGLLGGREFWPRRRPRHTSEPRTSATGSQETPVADARGSEISLDVDHVSRSFGGLKAVTDFSARVDPGELVGLIGPNGAGKTTVFNLVTGVYPPTTGHIRLGQRRIDGHKPAQINRAGVARTFQNIRLFGNLSVLDNVCVAFGLHAGEDLFHTILRAPRFARRRRESELEGMELLRAFQLDTKADYLAKNLPYGDQRRLEIARALATNPKILLLDEPAAGMNPQEKIELMNLIRFIRDQFHVGIWLIEHDMKLVMNICERITVLDHGETIAVGSPAEVQANPKVIAAYLGEPE